jgi:hypothetical protein
MEFFLSFISTLTSLEAHEFRNDGGGGVGL